MKWSLRNKEKIPKYKIQIKYYTNIINYEIKIFLKITLQPKMAEINI